MRTPPSVLEKPRFQLWPPDFRAKGIPDSFPRAIIAALTSSLDAGKKAQAGTSASLAASQYVAVVFLYNPVRSGLLSDAFELEGA